VLHIDYLGYEAGKGFKGFQETPMSLPVFKSINPIELAKQTAQRPVEMQSTALICIPQVG
jgi:hypothetical protein